MHRNAHSIQIMASIDHSRVGSGGVIWSASFALDSALISPDQELAEPITSVEDLEEYSRTKLGDLQSLSSTLLEHLNFKPEQEACVGWGVGGRGGAPCPEACQEQEPAWYRWLLQTGPIPPALMSCQTVYLQGSAGEP